MTVSRQLLSATQRLTGTIPNYWILRFNTDTDLSYVHVDASGNFMACGEGDKGALYVVIDSSGNVTTQRRLFSGTTNTYDYWFEGANGPSGDFYLGGQIGGNANSDTLLARYNSAGTLQWSRRVTSSGSNYDSIYGLVVDSSENIYCYGRSYSAGGARPYMWAYNSSGTILAQYVLNTTTVNAQIAAAHPDGSIIIIGGTNSGAWIAKVSTSGVIAWQKYVGYVYILPTSFRGVTCDTSGNIYATGDGGLTCKFDTSGTLLWSRVFVGGSRYAWYCTVDSSGNLYVTGEQDAARPNDSFIMKYDTSGNQVWGRQISHSTDGLYMANSRLIGSDFYFGGYAYPSSGITSGVVMKYPTNGSILGTFGDYTISEFTPIVETTLYSTTATTHSFSTSSVIGGGTVTATTASYTATTTSLT